MTHYTVCCGYASHYHRPSTDDLRRARHPGASYLSQPLGLVGVAWEAGKAPVTLGEALEKAIEQAGDDPHWKSVDQRPAASSQTFVEALAEGEDADPWLRRQRHDRRDGPPTPRSDRFT